MRRYPFVDLVIRETGSNIACLVVDEAALLRKLTFQALVREPKLITFRGSGDVTIVPVRMVNVLSQCF